MRIIIARCSATYAGRMDTIIEPALRAIFIKNDGSVSIHNDLGNKPLNYMGNKGSAFSEYITENDELGEHTVWVFENSKERLVITLEEIISNTETVELDQTEKSVIRNGTESHLQEWLAENPHELGGNYMFVAREFQTEEGFIDLLMKDEDGEYVVVEVKRVAMMPAVSQVKRYVDSIMKDHPEFGNVRGMITALDIRPKTIIAAGKKDYKCHVIDPTWKEKRAAQKSEEKEAE